MSTSRPTPSLALTGTPGTATTPEASGASAAPVIPRGRAGWWHEYVCPTHGTELRARTRAPRSDDTHLCPHGCVLRGEPYEGAWQVIELQQCARDFRDLARRYLASGAEADRSAAQALVTDFCLIYAEAVAEGWTDSAATWMLRGKLFHQALTEAIWGTSLAHGVLTLLDADARWGRSSADLAEASQLFTGLLDTVTEARRVLVEDRQDLRNNYTAWLICAGISATQVLARLDDASHASGGGDTGDVSSWWDGPAGLWAHIDAAVHPDGWEWEGATYYHYFVLRAYLLALRGQAPAELPEKQRAVVIAMLRVLVDLATDGGVLPVLHDGPYRRPQALQELLEVCVLGRQLVDLPGLEQLEAGTRLELGPGATTLEDQLQEWYAGPALTPPKDSAKPRASVSFPDTGHLVLRSVTGRWQAVVDAGSHGGAHGHLDKLGLYLYGDREVWQPAPGVPPYGSSLRHSYYATSAAHPTVRVDGHDQADTDARVLLWESAAESTRAVVSAPDVFAGVRFQRHLLMRGDVLLDAVHVSAAEAHDVVLGLRPADRLDAQPHDANFLTTCVDGGAVAPRTPGRDLLGCHLSSSVSTFGWTPVRGPADDPARLLGGIDWSVRSADVWFVSVYEPKDGPTAEHPRLRLLHCDEGGIEVEATPAGSHAFRHHFQPAPDELTPTSHQTRSST